MSQKQRGNRLSQRKRKRRKAVETHRRSCQDRGDKHYLSPLLISRKKRDRQEGGGPRGSLQRNKPRGEKEWKAGLPQPPGLRPELFRTNLTQMHVAVASSRAKSPLKSQRTTPRSKLKKIPTRGVITLIHLSVTTKPRKRLGYREEGERQIRKRSGEK